MLKPDRIFYRAFYFECWVKLNTEQLIQENTKNVDEMSENYKGVFSIMKHGVAKPIPAYGCALTSHLECIQEVVILNACPFFTFLLLPARVKYLRKGDEDTGKGV